MECALSLSPTGYGYHGPAAVHYTRKFSRHLRTAHASIEIILLMTFTTWTQLVVLVDITCVGLASANTYTSLPINVSGSTAMVLAGRFAQNPNAWQSPGSGKIDLREQMMYTGMFEGGFHDV